MASSRLAGQDLASSVNSCWLPKVSNGVVVVAVASSGVACAVMWLSVSMVNVVILVVLLCRVLRGPHMDHSAGLEMQGNSEQNRRWGTDGDGGTKAVGVGRARKHFRRLETDRDQERYLDTVEVWRSSRHGPTI